jgi:transcriptional regulator GlxA family with amidase domain
MNFSEKKHRARMDRAAWLLRTTDYSISKICEEVGYISENSFFKAFKKLYSTTPAKYRKDLRK